MGNPKSIERAGTIPPRYYLHSNSIQILLKFRNVNIIFRNSIFLIMLIE